MITEKDFKELENKCKEKSAQKELTKKYKALKFEHNHPTLFKIKNMFNKDKL